ncbi:MAG: hypothetical protein ABI143_02265 [Caldimonas sp.]
MQAVRIIVEATQAEEVRIDEDSSLSRRVRSSRHDQIRKRPCFTAQAERQRLAPGHSRQFELANKLPRGAPAALSEDIKFAAVNYYVKESFSKDAVPPLIAKIGAENDVVLTAIGAAVRAARLVFLTPSRSRSWGSPARS